MGLDLLELLRGFAPEAALQVRLGTVASNYAGGRPRVKFDGESTASTKAYPKLTSYSTPAAGDRVLLLQVGNGWVVLGKVE